MKRCRIHLFDSFSQASADVSELLRIADRSTLLRSMRRFLDGRNSGHVSGKGRRAMERMSSSQLRSWKRGNFTLLFREARKQQRAVLASAALQIAIEDGVDVDPAWAKDALSACSNQHEMLAIREALYTASPAAFPLPPQLQQRLHDNEEGMPHLHSGSVEGNDGNKQIVAQPDENIPAWLAIHRRTTSEISTSEVAGFQNAMRRMDTAIARGRDSLISPTPAFERYYLRQGIVKDERELVAMVEAMRARPPVCLRVHTSHMLGGAVRDVLTQQNSLRPVSWLPRDSGAFVLETALTEKAMDSASLGLEMQRVRQLLTSLGRERLVSFQSESSMLPVHLLQATPADVVLDMCASPGSKTMQLVDTMATKSARSHSAIEGCVLANDVHANRVYPLVRRVGNRFPHVGITKINGAHFPTTTISSDNMRFDRILVDAPCSGEGRMNRDHISWRLWHPQKGLQFYSSQVALLRRAVQLTKPDGTIVYSTCTLNPIENEAVVATILSEGDVELCAPLQRLHGLSLSHGLREWVVPGKNGALYERPVEALQSSTAEPLPPAVFSSTTDSGILDAIAENTRRVLPHLNNKMEGFFVAVLRRKRSSSAVYMNTLQSGSPVGSTSILRGAKLDTVGFSHPLVRENLGAFFNDDSDVFSRAMSRARLSLLLNPTGGVQLLSSSVLQTLSAIPASHHIDPIDRTHDVSQSDFAGHSGRVNSTMPTVPLFSPQLLESGVVAIDSKTGHLTEAGAASLAAVATRHVFQIPIRALFLLLSAKELTVSSDWVDPEVAAKELISNAALTNAMQRGKSSSEAPEWVTAILHGVLRESNAIISASSEALRGVCVPVHARRQVSSNGGSTSQVQFRLLLTPASRQRMLAVLNRLHVSTRTERVESRIEPRVASMSRSVNQSVRNVSELSSPLERRGIASQQTSTARQRRQDLSKGAGYPQTQSRVAPNTDAVPMDNSFSI